MLLRNLYFKVSAASRSKLRRILDAGGLHQIRSWFHTMDAVCLPLLISEEYHTPLLETECDVLSNWALENCAHHYAQFQSDLKRLKKGMRKSFALHNDINHVDCPGYMNPYWRAAKAAFSRTKFGGPADIGRWVLLWCQTRATGMADSVMIGLSYEKFERTVTETTVPVILDPEVVRKVVRPMVAASGRTAKVSCGPTACLESTRAKGGKTAFLSHLAKHRCVYREYNFRTLESTEVEPRPVRSAQDLVQWATYQLLHNPTYSRIVRVHGVAEPSKARTITVAPYAYQVIMGVFAHIFQPCLTAKQVRSGLKADRHLWRFLTDVLNPQNKDWGELIDQNVYGLSTDLSEATDWGDHGVARQLWQAMIQASECDEFPLGLSLLAKTFYCGKRFCFVPDPTHQFYKLVIANRGWLMGDMMTKVILTLSHQYCCEASGLRVYTLVGDDEISLDSRREVLEAHLDTLGKIFKVSEDDTFISRDFMFYCEEGSLVPQKVQDTPHVRMRRGQELDYLDYPRIRLLLPQIIETDAYSMTNIGRFALLGKESRWVHSSNGPAARYFTQASLLQHILVPQEPDTVCPYTPTEIGGDGAFPHSVDFMRRIVEDKPTDPREVKYRLSSLLNNKFSYKFLRTERLDKVVHKHHLYLPKIEGLRKLLPEESVLDTSDPNTKKMLGSLRVSSIRDPQAVFMELAKGLYYKALLEGKTPPEPTFNIDRQFTGGHTHEPTVDYQLFLDTWKNPGFNFASDWGYMVDTRGINSLNPMNLKWGWDLQTKPAGARQLFEDWLHENVDLREQSMDDIISLLRDRKPLPDRVVKRLNLFLESDSYILHTLNKEWAEHALVGIITRDQRLCRLVQRKLSAWNKDRVCTVVCVDPAIYMIGRLQEVEDSLKPPDAPEGWSMPVIEDPGAMLHVDYNEFDDGFPLDEEIWDRSIRYFESRNIKVPVATLQPQWY